MRRCVSQKSWIKRAYDDYTNRRQIFADLAERYGKDPKTIRKKFDAYFPVTGELVIPVTAVNLILDATFFARSDGYLVARALKRNLYWFPISSEKVEHYERCLATLTAAGCTFASFTIDGRRGVRQMLLDRYPHVPVQHCQFHQLQTITQKLTKRPKLPAGKALRVLALTLTKTDRTTFTALLDAWEEQWGHILRERSFSATRRRQWRYTHEKLRSAYFSLRRNLPWLFTYQKFPHLHMPNTTNSCDGSFTHWKNKVKLHRGIAKERKKKVIDYLLEK